MAQQFSGRLSCTAALDAKLSAATNRLDSQPQGLPGLVRLFSMLRRKTSHPRFQRLDRSAYGDAQPGYLIDYYHPV